MTTVSTSAPSRLWLKNQYSPMSGTDSTAMAIPTFVKSMSRFRRVTAALPLRAVLMSANARPMPSMSAVRSLKSV